MQDTRHNLKPDQAVQSLVPDVGTRDEKIGPDTEVLCLHRGDEVLEDMFDSRPYRIAPGWFKTTAAVARHFKARAVVPGSRDPVSGKQASYITIIGTVDFETDGSFRVRTPVDKPEEWSKFTAAELAEIGDAREALDPGSVAGHTTIVDTSSALSGKPQQGGSSRVKGGGGGSGGRGVTKLKAETNDGRQEAPAVMAPIPPDENAVVQEARAATAQAAAEGHRSR